jgi:flagellin
MRVQHNIVAMNSYRNYNNNTKSINKNLEKLSSGYKINRAGDDAAGLAISEKMRAQITGIEGAQKNAKDGISLVQTAEGALTEVHSMLNRMYQLAEQSANGTYDNTTDRAQLQKEVESLRTEINRIADSSNFNGLNLLDGSLSGASQVANVGITESTALESIATSGTATADACSSLIANAKLKQEDIGKTMDLTVTWKTGSGEERTTTVSMTFQGDGNGGVSATAAENYFTDANGNKYELTSDKLSQANLEEGLLAGLQRDEEFASTFTSELASHKLQFTSKEFGSKAGVILSIGVSENFSVATKTDIWGATPMLEGAIDVTASPNQSPKDAMQKIDATSLTVGVAADELDDLKAAIFEIDGSKFLLSKASGGVSNDNIKALGSDVTIISVANGTPDAADAETIAAEISRVTGMKTYANNADSNADIEATDIVFSEDRLRLSGSALTLQIGDTAAKYNQLDVQIGDVHVNKLGTDNLKVADIDISKQGGAQQAMDAIKAAINTVSDIRGTLGATQNRLEHTINNLSVMQENIQDAESTIRDTDVADEMMKYTKNSILVQSAQAMLAQANQQPQGVLQLLQ